MPKKATPTNLSIDRLERDGWSCCEVERRVCRWVTKDLFGFADILAIHPEKGTLLVQTTSDSHLADRLKKVQAEPLHKTWLLAGRGWHRIEVHGWKIKDGRHVCRCVEVPLTKCGDC